MGDLLLNLSITGIENDCMLVIEGHDKVTNDKLETHIGISKREYDTLKRMSFIEITQEMKPSEKLGFKSVTLEELK